MNDALSPLRTHVHYLPSAAYQVTPKCSGLTANIYYLIVSVGQKLRNVLVGLLWLRVWGGSESGCWSGLRSSSVPGFLWGFEDGSCRWHLSGGISFLSHEPLPWLFGFPVTLHLAPPKTPKTEAAMYFLIQHRFHHILMVTDTSTDWVWEGMDVNAKRWGSLGAIWRLAITTYKCSGNQKTPPKHRGRGSHTRTVFISISYILQVVLKQGTILYKPKHQSFQGRNPYAMLW